jgi:acylphosphatase
MIELPNFKPLNPKLFQMQHWNIHVTGKVQGVGYRYFVEQTAQELGLKGFVRNEPDGSVYIEVEGKKLILEELVERCFEGTTASAVTAVDTTLGELLYFQQFEIRR